MIVKYWHQYDEDDTVDDVHVGTKKFFHLARLMRCKGLKILAWFMHSGCAAVVGICEVGSH